MGDKAPVRVLSSDLAGIFPYAVAVPFKCGEMAVGYTEAGWWQENGSNPKYNLENVPQAIYINIFPVTPGFHSVSAHPSRKDADEYAEHVMTQRLARIRIEDYEGRFDE